MKTARIFLSGGCLGFVAAYALCLPATILLLSLVAAIGAGFYIVRTPEVGRG